MPAQNSYYKWLILLNVMITTFMAVLDSTIVNTALPTIMGSLGASMNTSEWILTGYMLSLAAVLPASGWIANRFGFRNVFVCAISIFTFGSLMCGYSSTIESLIFWRIIEGIGSGMLIPVGMAIVTDIFPPKERGLAMGVWSIASAASVSFGPMLGGYLVDHLSWNSIFYVNVPIGIFCIIYTFVLQHKDSPQAVKPFDIGGFISSIVFLPLLLFALSQVNSSTNPLGWKSPLVMGCIWVSIIAFVLFLYIELTVDAPLLNLRIFKDRDFSLSNIVIFFFGISMFGSTFLIPLYMQQSLGYTAFEAGLVFLPVGIIQGIVAPLSGKVTEYINPKIVIVIGTLLLAYSFHMNYQLSFLTEKDYIIRSLVIRGLGLGIMYPPLITLSINHVPHLDIPDASSITNTLRQIGGSIGVAFFTFFMASRSQYHLEIYSESINYTGNEMSLTLQRIEQAVHSDLPTTPQVVRSQAYACIDQRIQNEAFISGVNDNFYIGTLLILLSGIPVLFFSRKS